MALEYDVVIIGPLQTNCTVIGFPSGSAICVDPGGDIDPIMEAALKLKLTIKKVYHTHGHFDHILGSGVLRKATQAELLIHKNDKAMIVNMAKQVERFGYKLNPEAEVGEADVYFDGGEDIELDGEVVGKIIHTPGHTPGSSSFYFPSANLVCAGDTLFAGSVGRTDLPGGNFHTIEESIKSKLYALPNDVKVIPGHGSHTSIGREKKFNMFVRDEPTADASDSEGEKSPGGGSGTDGASGAGFSAHASHGYQCPACAMYAEEAKL
ncbi:hypothetical protein SmJEL517_g02918 [Synchytrium microbalum]|uniref:Metallo-beta-lactamase domain-containing protein n=1 Tax=Synchytrium microbalum TaxID=1806994 RepID=A0A507C4P1_9FUNG|nr:uncharacterized protein SmJEL517_g02918 [Synchytrium microbalum]TPX34451.1 hypothetical protein SmJEL517_g02918 [Synchytrium microbalum]